jgi:hypothetical protein
MFFTSSLLAYNIYESLHQLFSQQIDGFIAGAAALVATDWIYAWAKGLEPRWQ